MTDTSFDPRQYLQQGSFKDVKLGLARTRELLDTLGNPQDRVPMIHVGGTNGKGSTSVFIATILQEAGYKVGLFTSPYILQFNERIQVNRCNIPEDDLVRITARVRDNGATINQEPTSFEALTAVAFTYFAECECDIAVVEVGLGGRLDSTNVIDHPLVNVITPISYDHTAILGDTLEAIASEKAGIIKQSTPVLSAVQEPGVVGVLDAAAAGKNTRVTYVDTPFDVRIEDMMQCFSLDGVGEVSIALAGTYQPGNAALAVAVIQSLADFGFSVSAETIQAGLAHTSWPGRFEVVHTNPYIIIDGGHNPQGAQVLAESLKTYFPQGNITFVMSVCADKDYGHMISAVKDMAGSFYVAATTYTDRAMNPNDLKRALEKQGARYVYACASIRAALEGALQNTASDGVVCCFGSLYSVAEIKEAIQMLDL